MGHESIVRLLETTWERRTSYHKVSDLLFNYIFEEYRGAITPDKYSGAGAADGLETSEYVSAYDEYPGNTLANGDTQSRIESGGPDKLNISRK